MEKCFQRDPTNPHTITDEIGTGCSRLFNISKFYMQEYICYRIQVRNKAAISFTRVAHSLFFGNTFYVVVLNPVFANAYAIMPIIFTG